MNYQNQQQYFKHLQVADDFYYYLHSNHPPLLSYHHYLIIMKRLESYLKYESILIKEFLSNRQYESTNF